jgi:hypothetical protein
VGGIKVPSVLYLFAEGTQVGRESKVSNTTPNLWPVDFVTSEAEYPDAVLKQQAELFGKKTKHLVEAEVRSPDHAFFLQDKIRKSLYLVAPALGGYSYRLFTIEYGIEPYPVVITGVGDDVARICPTKQEFLATLKDLFASQETRRIIVSLLAQSKTG